ncbi:MAG: TIGR02147 family protein [Polyangiales bacterium]
MGAAEIDVFAYLDYRAYLRDYYDARKRAGRGFSYRNFSRRAGLKSPNYLKLVIDGERNLSPDMAERFAIACGLKDDEVRYFVDLVAFGQASTLAERDQHYARLTSFQRYRNAHKLDLAHAAYYSAWYMPAIRELAARPGFRDDPEWIARQLVPEVSPIDAARALDTLLELGLLVRKPGIGVQQTDTLLSTGPETRGLHIANYHRMMMQRATESIDLIAASQRDISSLTLCLGPEGLAAIKERIQRFRKELLELSALETQPEQVVQINFQLFPLTKRSDEGDA